MKLIRTFFLFHREFNYFIGHRWNRTILVTRTRRLEATAAPVCTATGSYPAQLRKYLSRIHRPNTRHRRATRLRLARESRKCCGRVFGVACVGSRTSWARAALHRGRGRRCSSNNHRRRITRPCWWK